MDLFKEFVHGSGLFFSDCLGKSRYPESYFAASEKNAYFISDLEFYGRLCRLAVNGNSAGLTDVVSNSPPLYDSGKFKELIKPHYYLP